MTTSEAQHSGPALSKDFRGSFSRLSTAVKMLLILATALFPLGFVAVLASIDAARDGRSDREESARAQAFRSAGVLGDVVARDILALRIVADAARSRVNVGEPCRLIAQARSAGDLVLSRFGLFDRSGRLLCGDADLAPLPGVRVNGARADLDMVRGEVRTLAIVDGIQAVGTLERGSLRDMSAAPSGAPAMDMWLQQGSARVRLVDRYEPSLLQRTIVGRARLARSDVFAVAAVGAIPISATEIATILLPLVMWLAAALLGWLIVNRLLLRPIVAMQKAVLAYRPGSATVAIPDLSTPATEIRDLGDAFARVTHTVAEHEAELELAIARQGRLIREVHHRVKNNLQVVASLLNLHARGARSTDASNAYATIQRRVDALSVVHRNHFAELEDDRGVALRNLLSELTANLRATAPDDATGMAITLDLDTAYVNQDVAVSVAFFVTEVVEHAMLCTPNRPVGVVLRRTGPIVARLSVSASSLRGDVECQEVDARQFERITTGLSRQLRAVLERNTEDGVFAIDIAVLETAAST